MVCGKMTKIFAKPSFAKLHVELDKNAFVQSFWRRDTGVKERRKEQKSKLPPFT
jgi:hypothetical protein